ncbi:AAA family ATPase [Rhodococcus sp. KRD197]|uniref:AAA family ATPase n=1 Tax=Rhodococcus sp. KRD197 TaxID=2729731 RepID=UPI0019D1C1F5|nr:AAA family ATPase [Rhodococcus sp. KRD197]
MIAVSPTYAELADSGMTRDEYREYWTKAQATSRLSRSAQRVHERSMLDAFLTDRRAVFAPDIRTLLTFLSALPIDVYDYLDNAGDVGRLWTNDRLWDWDQLDVSDQRAVLFLRVDDDTRRLFAPEHLAEHPGVRVFASDPGLRLDHQFDQFESAGLDLDDFTPLVEVEAAETVAAERFYAAPEAYATVDMSVLMWNWSRLSANDIRADEARLEKFDTIAEGFGELTRQFHAAKAHELARERENPPKDTETAEDPEDTMTDTDTESFEYDPEDKQTLGLLDWSQLLSGEPEPFEWLVPGVFGRGLLYQLVSAPKVGKSLMVQEIAYRLAAGKPTFGTDLSEGHTRSEEPITVLYLDRENSRELVRDRFLEMGASPEDLARLHYASFPAIEQLDAGGARDIVALAKAIDAQLIVLDTVSRFVSGAENDADTYLRLYRELLVPLKREGRTIIRIDHTGKDAALGARGSSAKTGDVDCSWIMQKGASPSRFKLVREVDRTAHHPDVVHLLRRQSPLRHEVVTGKVTLSDLAADEIEDAIERLPEEVLALIADMDARNVPSTAGRAKAQEQYLASGGDLRVGTDGWSEAVRFRKARNAQ